MLDLKAKLASAGLVTDADIERVEQQKARRRGGARRGRSASGEPTPARDTAGLRIEALRKMGKDDRYVAIRRWVDKVRLDAPGAVPTEQARAFHFPEAGGRIGRLMLEPAVLEALAHGDAAIIAYMSNHGLAHAVVPAEGAHAVAELFPAWLRTLEGDPRAGEVDPNA